MKKSLVIPLLRKYSCNKTFGRLSLKYFYLHVYAFSLNLYHSVYTLSSHLLYNYLSICNTELYNIAFFATWYVIVHMYQNVQNQSDILAYWDYFQSFTIAYKRVKSILLGNPYCISDCFISINSYKGNFWVKMHNYLIYTAYTPLGISVAICTIF